MSNFLMFYDEDVDANILNDKNISLENTLLSFLHTSLGNLLGAGIKLIPLGQTEGQKIQVTLNYHVEKEYKKILNNLIKKYGGIDIVISNAGNAIQTVKSTDNKKVISVRTANFETTEMSNSANILNTNCSVVENKMSVWVEDKIVENDRPELTSA